MKYILIMMLLASLSAAGQDSLDFTTFTIDTVQKFAKPDTAYGYILAQMCQPCQPIYRPIISIKKSLWADSQPLVRYWRRQWLFGKIIYHYKPIPKKWKIIDYKQATAWK